MASQKIPPSVRLDVLTEAGYRCAVPTCRTILAIDLHHIDHVVEGGANTSENLIALCPTCHRLYHRGDISREAIRVWKGMLVALNRAFDAPTIDDLIYLSLDNRPRMYSADAVLQFRRLIAAGLVQADRGLPRIYGGMQQTQETIHRITLTERGRMVVEAWRAGDMEALARALSEGAGPTGPAAR